MWFCCIHHTGACSCHHLVPKEDILFLLLSWQGHCTREEESHSWKSAWRKLESLKEEGHVLAIGVSNFEPHLFKELLSLADTKVGVIQNWMDPFNQGESSTPSFIEK